MKTVQFSTNGEHISYAEFVEFLELEFAVEAFDHEQKPSEQGELFPIQPLVAPTGTKPYLATAHQKSRAKIMTLQPTIFTRNSEILEDSFRNSR
jgi:hypothetical protein